VKWRGPRRLTAVHDGAREALLPILRTGSLARWRQLDVCCPNQHRLMQVLAAGNAGLVVVAERQASSSYVPDDAAPRTMDSVNRARHVRRHRADPVVYQLDQLGTYYLTDHRGRKPYEHLVPAQCRCRQADVPVAWLRQQIAEGKRRAVWIGTDAVLG
jgi:hypothetical protein